MYTALRISPTKVAPYDDPMFTAREAPSESDISIYSSQAAQSGDRVEGGAS